MQLVWILVIIGVLLGFVMLVVYLPEQQITPYDDEARRLITQFTESGEYIGFDIEPSPPVTKYVYDSNNVITGKVDGSGNIIPVTEEEVKELSNVDLNVQDRILNESKICKMGYQCDITGKILLIDPSTGERIPPPYKYSLTIDCDYRDYCTLSPSVSIKPTLTFNDGTFKYPFVVTEKITVGEYRVTVFVTSYYTNEDGEQERRMKTRMIEVVN
mgnify:CR=1 FL=1